MNTNYHSQQLITPSFKAVKVAQARTSIGKIRNEIDIYKLGNEDKNFLQKLAMETEIKENSSNFAQRLIERWQEVFDYCTTMAFERNNITYIAMHKGKPCGIMTYVENMSKLFLDGICAIPQNGKKVPFTGQSLFLQLFKDAENLNTKNIKLEAIQDGPYDVESKYEKLGFKKDPTSTPYTIMTCSKYKIKEQLNELSSKINYIKTNSTQKINLEHTLD